MQRNKRKSMQNILEAYEEFKCHNNVQFPLNKKHRLFIYFLCGFTLILLAGLGFGIYQFFATHFMADYNTISPKTKARNIAIIIALCYLFLAIFLWPCQFLFLVWTDNAARVRYNSKLATSSLLALNIGSLLFLYLFRMQYEALFHSHECEHIKNTGDAILMIKEQKHTATKMVKSHLLQYCLGCASLAVVMLILCLLLLFSFDQKWRFSLMLMLELLLGGFLLTAVVTTTILWKMARLFEDEIDESYDNKILIMLCAFFASKKSVTKLQYILFRRNFMLENDNDSDGWNLAVDDKIYDLLFEE